MINARNYYLRESLSLSGSQFNETFCRLLLGDFIRTYSWEASILKVRQYPYSEHVLILQPRHVGCEKAERGRFEDGL